jgi:phosphopentomutase
MEQRARFIMVVLDGVGVGSAPDADRFGDAGADTLGNIARRMGGLSLPTLQGLGLGNLARIEGVPPAATPLASWGRMEERSRGKDSTLGHWELAGLITETALPVYPQGFPEDLLAAFRRATGVEGLLGNIPASGTEIIRDLGDRHIETGWPIVYTSGDSVFQIAAHEDVIPPPRLYALCEAARELLVGPHAVARVIARPFVGQPGAFARTANRRDFSLLPWGRIVLQDVQQAGHGVLAIGKIRDLYAGVGIDRTVKSRSNGEGMELLQAELEQNPTGEGLILLNLVDFDALWGHRLDTEGFAAGLADFDAALPGVIWALRPGDVLCLCADHGNDPTGTSTDHTREQVPLLVVHPGRPARDLGTRSSFRDMAASMRRHFGLPAVDDSFSFL